MCPCATTEVIAKFLSPTHGSVDDVDIPVASLLKRIDDRPGGAAGAQYRSRSPLGPARNAFIQIRGKTVTISVAAAQLAVLQPERIGSADHLRRLILSVEQRACHFLVGDSDIAADITVAAQ